MKKLIAVASTLLLIIGVTGCSSNSSSTPVPDPTYTSEPDPTPTHVYTTDEIYVSTVREFSPYYASFYTDSELINIASSACQYFRDGGDFETLAYSLVASLDSSDPDFFSFVGFTIGAGVAAYCPQYSYLISS